MSLTQKANQMWNKPEPLVFIVCLPMAAVVLLDPNHFSEILHSSMYSTASEVLVVVFFSHMALIRWTIPDYEVEWDWAVTGVLFVLYEAFGFFTVPPEIPQIALALAFIIVGIFGGCRKP